MKEGFSVSLASDADTVKAVDNANPYEHTMNNIGSDRIAVNYHGITHTHLDSLAHVNANGVFYNGDTPVIPWLKQRDIALFFEWHPGDESRRESEVGHGSGGIPGHRFG